MIVSPRECRGKSYVKLSPGAARGDVRCHHMGGALQIAGPRLLRTACIAAQLDPLVNPLGINLSCNSKPRHDPHSPWHCRSSVAGGVHQPMPSFPHIIPVAIRKSGSEIVGKLQGQLQHNGGLMNTSFPVHGKPFLWTFVREPLGHLASGYMEIENRMCDSAFGWSPLGPERKDAAFWIAWHKKICAWQRAHAHLFHGRETFGTVARVRSFVRELATEKLASLNSDGDINHAFSLCYWFCHSAPLLSQAGWFFVGKLENFDYDVGQMLRHSLSRFRQLSAYP